MVIAQNEAQLIDIKVKDVIYQSSSETVLLNSFLFWLHEHI